MLGEIAVITYATIDAVEVHILSHKILIADIHGELFAELVAEAKQTLVSQTGIRGGKSVCRRQVRSRCENQIASFGLGANRADTDTDVGLESACAVEIIDAVQHQVGRLKITVCA